MSQNVEPRISAQVPIEQLVFLDAEAKSLGNSRSAVIRRCIAAYAKQLSRHAEIEKELWNEL